jgi:HD superfamily phosphohydrolase
MAVGKIINDPVHGFISIDNEIDFKIIEHPYFQRLRRISQLGLTYLVYPGAHHTRFHHVIGAYHLMKKAIRVLRTKGTEITKEEEEGACRAILLHDIGHGPFSHALEHSIVPSVAHEEISLRLMNYFNNLFPGKLDVAISMFKKEYHKTFLNELISSQLDVDRLDYLKRDSFFTGVSEGVINSDRLISMLSVKNNELVVEQKAIYSVEKFILSRRLMYWQVYLHKTVLAAELMLEKLLLRAKELVNSGKDIYATPNFRYFLHNSISIEDFSKDSTVKMFCELDEYDVLSCIKEWIREDDIILSELSRRIIQRDLFKVKFESKYEKNWNIENLEQHLLEKWKIQKKYLHYFLFEKEINQNIYNPNKDIIRMSQKNGEIIPFGTSQENKELFRPNNTKKCLCAIELY